MPQWRSKNQRAATKPRQGQINKYSKKSLPLKKKKALPSKEKERKWILDVQSSGVGEMTSLAQINEITQLIWLKELVQHWIKKNSVDPVNRK